MISPVFFFVNLQRVYTRARRPPKDTISNPFWGSRAVLRFNRGVGISSPTIAFLTDGGGVLNNWHQPLHQPL